MIADKKKRDDAAADLGLKPLESGGEVFHVSLIEDSASPRRVLSEHSMSTR
jgi:hypothetical protein